MRSTGIVRRIDDLGRLVVPKEIRRQLHIKEGDPMELFVVDGSIVFKKYNFPSVKDQLKQLAEDISANQNIDGYVRGRIYEKIYAAIEIMPDDE